MDRIPYWWSVFFCFASEGKFYFFFSCFSLYGFVDCLLPGASTCLDWMIFCRCHRRGIAGKLGLATQWAFEQEEAGGEVNFKEGLAFYSSIGILQVRERATHSLAELVVAVTLFGRLCYVLVFDKRAWQFLFSRDSFTYLVYTDTKSTPHFLIMRWQISSKLIFAS